MKKKLIILTLVTFIFSPVLLPQDTYPGGTPIGRIFADYRLSLDSDNPYSGFNATRAWLGYKYILDENFSAQVIVDIGSPLDTPDVSSKRYAFFRNALIAYKKDNLTLSFGVTDTRAASTELKLWGKRYLSRPFLLNYKFVNVADIGLVADYRISPLLSVDAAILNGEGYTKIESNNHMLYAFGVTLTPVEGLTIRAYGDSYSSGQGKQSTLSATAGYQHKLFTLASSYNRKSNFDWTEGHNTDGFTVFGGINITPEFELFGRFDKVQSAVAEGETIPWNVSKDGTLVVTGVQYKIMKQLKISVNYQAWRPDDGSVPSTRFIQFNTEFRF